MIETDWLALQSIATRVGQSMARKWPGIEAEDMSQEALTALLERQELLEDFPANTSLIAAFMGRVAQSYASRERYDFTVRSARYLYTPAEIRALLTHAYWDESLRETSVPTGPDDRTSLLVWENVCIAIWDMDAAFQSLSPLDAGRLRLRYRDGAEYATDAARKAADRAVDTLTMYVNQRVNRNTADHDGPGSRKAGRLPAAA